MTSFRIDALVLVVASIITNCPFGNAKLSCKNAKNKNVDWFVVYKIPKTKHNADSFMRPMGGEMVYYDSLSKTPKWTLLPDDINNKTNNPIANTLAPIYEKESKVAYLLYNDQLPNGFNGTRGGHTKGALLAGQNSDFGTVWLQHSVPRFVEDVKLGYRYPTNGRENGQLFFCITFPLATVETISYHLQLQAANVYQTRYLQWTKQFQYFASLLNKVYIRNPQGVKVDILVSRGNRPVLAIAKSPKWINDVYTEELSGKIQDSITVQTWKNGAGGAQDMHCRGKYFITDVISVNIQTQRGALHFSSREDHSKWSVARKKGYFCFSSLNRMVSQWRRGGEITCILDIPLAKLFRGSIYKRNQCKAELNE
uniref:Deoxyribonuclease II n=1 Tax=Rhipicephalus appendiculatus TaxID=34631 RepID=A0A131Z4A4_RHIAP